MDPGKDEFKTTDIKHRWRAVLGSLEVQIANRSDFEAFLADTRAEALENDTLTVSVRNGFVAEWIRQRVMKVLRRTVREVFGSDIEIRVVSAYDFETQSLEDSGLLGDHLTWSAANQSLHRAALAEANARQYPLAKGMTFERFCESQSNAVSLNAAIDTSQTAQPLYNPLTILAETGQGKTHLLHAIAYQMREKGSNVICITAEAFLNDFVRSSRSRTVAASRDRYLGVDALIVDGIEKLVGRKETQVFFLDVINHLVTNNRQVVVAGNSSHPLHELADEIISKLAGGLETVIEPPDKKLRRALLRQHAIDRGVELVSEALDFLANRTVRNARELIGGITRVAAHVNIEQEGAQSSKPVVTRAVAIEAVRNRLTAPSPNLAAPDDIINAVSSVFDVPPDAVRRSKRGSRNVTVARDIVIYLLRENCGLTSSQTGQILGGRSHSTIIAALQRYSKRRQEDVEAMRMEQETLRVLSSRT